LKAFLTGLLLLASNFPASAWSADSDELWKINMETEMTGMPMPEVTQMVCLRKGEVYKPTSVPHQKHCKLSDIKVSGKSSSWHIHCSDREQMDGDGVVSRTADTMKGTVNLSSKNIQLTQVFSGKLIGTCQAK
jgi:hypothetical protein